MSDQIDWAAIREDYETGSSLRTLEKKYDVSKSAIGDRKHKEQWDRTRLERTQKKNAKPTTRDVNAAVRVLTAIKLRLEDRMTWEEIAAQAGYGSRGAAHNAVMRELDRCITHNVKELRDEELYMLQQVQARSYKAAVDEENTGWTWAVDRFVALSKRKSELMGLDQPVERAQNANLVVIREIPSGYLGLQEAPKHD